MGSLNGFLEHMDWFQLFLLLIGAVACLFCITFHELAHGFAAYQLGDPTAKVNGRLTLNPISHIDWIGLMLLLTVRVGWAKPVPVDMRNFRHPKRDMAITALAGPAANFLLATAALGVASLIYHFAPQGTAAAYAIYFFLYMAVLSVGLGVFNQVPIPPLDGSKILFALLPDRIYYQYLRYERFFILAVVLLAWMGVFSVPLSFCMEGIVRGLCAVTAFPFQLAQHAGRLAGEPPVRRGRRHYLFFGGDLLIRILPHIGQGPLDTGTVQTVDHVFHRDVTGQAPQLRLPAAFEPQMAEYTVEYHMQIQPVEILRVLLVKLQQALRLVIQGLTVGGKHPAALVRGGREGREGHIQKAEVQIQPAAHHGQHLAAHARLPLLMGLRPLGAEFLARVHKFFLWQPDSPP